MAGVCLAGFAILACGLATLYGLDWYRNRKRNRRSIRDIEEDYTTKEAVAEQLA